MFNCNLKICFYLNHYMINHLKCYNPNTYLDTIYSNSNKPLFYSLKYVVYKFFMFLVIGKKSL